jgi:hypothetical protein
VVDMSAVGDTQFPAIDWSDWQEISREVHPAAPGDSAGYTLRILDRVSRAAHGP